MQQTQNLKLNLIETSDPLSPAPLNENADTLDAALAALDETAADLTQRMIALENCRMHLAVSMALPPPAPMMVCTSSRNRMTFPDDFTSWIRRRAGVLYFHRLGIQYDGGGRLHLHG